MTLDISRITTESAVIKGITGTREKRLETYDETHNWHSACMRGEK